MVDLVEEEDVKALLQPPAAQPPPPAQPPPGNGLLVSQQRPNGTIRHNIECRNIVGIPYRSYF